MAAKDGVVAEAAAMHTLARPKTAAYIARAIIAILLYHQYFVHDTWLQVFVRFGGWGVEVFTSLSGVGIVYSLKK